MGDENQFFSIIVPTYNRPRQLFNCLKAISRLDFPSDRFEVIVVDDGSEYSLKTLLDPFNLLMDLKKVNAKHGGPANARNIGASKAIGSYLVFTDDDCEPTNNWLNCISERALKMPNHAIGGKTINGLPDNIYSTSSQFLISYLYEYYKTDFNYKRFFTSNNLSVPAAHFHAIGGFDETTYHHAAGEDRDFCYRWQKRGLRMIYDPNIVIYHYHRLNLRTFMYQHFNYGQSAFRFHHFHKHHDIKPIKFEPLSFYIKMLMFPFIYAQGSRLIRIQILLLLSQFFNTAGYLIEKFDFLRYKFLKYFLKILI